MAQENVVVVRFTEPSKAYQALSVLKECDADGRIGLESAAVVERTAEGELRIPESADNVGLVGTASGSLIGMLVGVLGGPVGVLLGWGAGALMGGAFDVDRAVTSDEALTVLGQAIPPGVDRRYRERGGAGGRGDRRARCTNSAGRSPAGRSPRSWTSSRRPRRPPTRPRARRGGHCARSARPNSTPASRSVWAS